MTAYQVLEQAEGRPGVFETVDRVDAHNDLDAIRKATADLDADGRTGTFVAVPARSWRLRTREIEIAERDVWT